MSVAKADTAYCDFCGKSQHEVAMMIAGPRAHICSECIGLAAKMVTKRIAERASADAPPQTPQAGTMGGGNDHGTG